jgi:hypothetical protein
MRWAFCNPESQNPSAKGALAPDPDVLTVPVGTHERECRVNAPENVGKLPKRDNGTATALNERWRVHRDAGQLAGSRYCVGTGAIAADGRSGPRFGGSRGVAIRTIEGFLGDEQGVVVGVLIVVCREPRFEGCFAFE